MLPVPPPDIHAIALAVYHESRGEPFTCQILVASVVKNRMKSRKKTAHEVISEKGQFKWYGHRKVIKEKGAYYQSIAVAEMVLSSPKIAPYQFFHKGKRGGFRCGEQVFSIAYNGK